MQAEQDSLPTLVVCPNCSHRYSGTFCPSCGQKKLSERSKSFYYFLEEALHGFFHYDGKIYTAIKYLITRPGFLTLQFFQNRRQAFIKPFSLLLLFTLFLYFFGLKLHILHEFKIERIMEENSRIGAMITNYIQDRGIDRLAFLQEFDAYKTGWQKLYYTLLVPLTAIVCGLLLIPKKRFFVEHLVFSIHAVCTYIILLFFYLVILITAQLILDFGGDVFWGLQVLMLVMIIYSALAVRRAYEVRWIYAIVAGGFIGFFIVVMDLAMHNTIVAYLTYFFNYVI